MRDIGKNIRAARIRCGLTQEELANMLFVTRQTISNYENGKSRPDIEMLEQIATASGTNVNELLYGLETESGPRKAISVIAIITGSILIFGELIKSILLLVTHTKYALQEGTIAPKDVSKSEVHFKLLNSANIVDRLILYITVVGCITLFILCLLMRKPIKWKIKVIYISTLFSASFVVLAVFSSIDLAYPFLEYAMPWISIVIMIIILLIINIICDEIRRKKKVTH